MIKIHWWEKRGLEIIELQNNPALTQRQHIMVNNNTVYELFWLTILLISCSVRELIIRIKGNDFIKNWETIKR